MTTAAGRDHAILLNKNNQFGWWFKNPQHYTWISDVFILFLSLPKI
jgi:hypothetical protein